jgi:hypothetical protein
LESLDNLNLNRMGSSNIILEDEVKFLEETKNFETMESNEETVFWLLVFIF